MKTFNEIVSEHFKLSADDVVDTMTMHDIPGWDSMNFLLLVSDLEKEFNMTFSMDDVLTVGSIGDIRVLVEKK